ncbi:MAG: hypothetical protein M3680_34790, partial [Myxococcota bacterium]|nr:hypothetical protein [Myxococcota bacterium]
TVVAAGAARAPQNPQWPGFGAEVHAGFAELAAAAGDRAGAAAAWLAVRAALEPLATTGRMHAARKNLLDRARGTP